MMRRLAVLALASLLWACGDDGGSGVPDARGIDARMPDADVGDVPRVEPAACRFMVHSSLGLTEGANYTCGDLVVEEDRGGHVGRIRLHFIRVKSNAGTNNATIYLDGGPGGDGQGILDYAAYLGAPFLNGLLVDGDFLVIGQRGTALSVPYLDCEQEGCEQIAHLPSYNTAYNADDVNDLRATLGIQLLNVYGISYGSRLGLEVLRRHGQHVRAAVIEGLVPAQTHWPAAIPASFYSAITSLNTSCANAGACGTTYGNLVTKFTTGVNALNSNPVSIQLPNETVPVDGDTYAYLLFRMMYSRSSYASLPLLINDLAIRRTDRVNNFLATWLQADRGDISMGLYYSVVCGELYNPADPNAPTVANQGVPAAFVNLFGGSFYSLEAACTNWPKGNLQASLAQPVTSSVRTLVSSGRLDPITPPSFGDVAATTLSNKVVVVHENSGHGATLQTPCGAQNLQAFLANPAGAHDTSCAASITVAYAIPPMFVAPPISVKQIRAELAIAPLPPFLRARLPRISQ
ncbi:MAG TPA: alpha/beta fold hydrolase [Kofleriaceae bacterium]